MSVLLLGLIALVGSGWMARRSSPGRRACLWVLAIGVVAGGSIWFHGDRLASYQVKLLGQRFQPRSGGVVAEVSGDRDRADYYLPGAGNDPVAVLVRDSAGGIVVRATDPTAASAVAVVRTPRRWRGTDHVVLSSVAVAPGDRIRVGSPDGGPAEVFAFARSKVSLAQKAGIGGTCDELVHMTGGGDADGSSADDGSADDGSADARTVVVPYPDGSGVLGLFPRRPGVYQRTYPLAELAAAAGLNGPALAGLRSFLYYDDEGGARLAVLDEAVHVTSADGAAKTPVELASAWTERGRRPRVTVAGLPYRDFPEPGLAAGERYGARPLGSFGVRVDEEWVTVQGVRSEVRSIATIDLPPESRAVSTFASGRSGDARLHPIRLAVGAVPEGPAGLTFVSPSNVFVAAGQAVLRFPSAPSAGWFELLAPSGQARWDTGRPFTLSDGERGLLLRIDGLAASWSFMLLLAALFLLAAVPFALIETTGAARGVALAALGIAAVRLLLSTSAMARYPFVDEGHQIGLWLIPALPFFVCALGRKREGEISAATDAEAGGIGKNDIGGASIAKTTAFGHWAAENSSDIAAAGLAAALIFLASALFPASPAKSMVLLVTVGGAAAFALTPFDRRVRLWARCLAGLRRIAKALPTALGRWAAAWPGAAAGLAILLGRVALEVAGFREQIAVGGTRVGLSVLHTPVSLLAFALLAAAHDRRVAKAAPDEHRRRAVKSLGDLCAFLGLAYVGTSAAISDFGIAFTTLPGPLLVLALVGAWWARAQGLENATAEDGPTVDAPGANALAEDGPAKDGPGANALAEDAPGANAPVMDTPARRPRPRGTNRKLALAGALPLFLFVVPQAFPDLFRPILPDMEGPRSGLEEWSRNDLLLLERGDPDALRLIGESRSEALAVMRETMRSYTRGNWWGQGFLEGRVSPQIRTTATREHVVTGLLASQWGAPGTLGLLALLAAVLRPLLPADRWSGRARFVSATALLTFSGAGVYMVFANYGWALFTGKNVYLLGLDSLGDTLEALAVLGLAAAAMAHAKAKAKGSDASTPRSAR